MGEAGHRGRLHLNRQLGSRLGHGRAEHLSEVLVFEARFQRRAVLGGRSSSLLRAR